MENRNLFLVGFLIVVLGLVMVSSIPVIAAAEAPATQWEHFLGTGDGYSVLQTADGGYALTGTNSSMTFLIKTDY